MNSHKIIEYFEAIPGVPKIRDKYNPATWMLEVSSLAAEVRLGLDFAEYYKSSSLYQRNKALVRELSEHPPGAKDLYFPTQYSQSTWGQFKSCIWKQWLTYWRSPDYNLVRYFFTLAAALMVGTYEARTPVVSGVSPCRTRVGHRHPNAVGVSASCGLLNLAAALMVGTVFWRVGKKMFIVVFYY